MFYTNIKLLLVLYGKLLEKVKFNQNTKVRFQMKPLMDLVFYLIHLLIVKVLSGSGKLARSGTPNITKKMGNLLESMRMGSGY